MTENTIDKIINFLNQIGLPTEEQLILEETFLPGITVDGGTLIFDPQQVEYPGDLLHEAGHLAILSPSERGQSFSDLGDDGGYEMAAIAWSYAACLHLKLSVDVLFHKGGYRGEAAWIAETFQTGRYFGLPMLEWKGMASTNGDKIYPQMKFWLCQV